MYRYFIIPVLSVFLAITNRRHLATVVANSKTACTIPASMPPPPAKSTTALGASSGRTGFNFVSSKFLQTSDFGESFLVFAFLIKAIISSLVAKSCYSVRIIVTIPLPIYEALKPVETVWIRPKEVSLAKIWFNKIASGVSGSIFKISWTYRKPR